MNKLRLELLAAKYPLWDIARIGPKGLERVMQSSELEVGVHEMLASTLSADFPEHTKLRITVELDIPPDNTHAI